jgi:CBS domain-containing protein
MERRQVRRIPIVDRENRTVGIIAQADIATRLKDPQKVTEVVEVISRPKATAA